MKIARGLLAVSLLLCGATCPSAVAAAQGRAAEQLDPLRWSALNAIEKEVERARGYSQARARVIVWTSAADALWDFEPAKARSLLRDAYEQVESAAGEKNEDDRDALYLQAALSLSRNGEHERALDAAERARDGQRRDAVLTYIRRALIQSLISRGEFYDAASAARKIESPEERADVTVLIVAAARKKGDVGLAMSVLQETQKLLAGGSGSASQARAYLWLASSYTTIDTSAGFELMAAAIKAANGAKELEDVRSEPRYLQLGGSSRLAVQVGDNKGDFRAGLRLLARSDFGRTIALAESFENELLRGVSVVTAAASVLKAQPQTDTSSK